MLVQSLFDYPFRVMGACIFGVVMKAGRVGYYHAVFFSAFAGRQFGVPYPRVGLAQLQVCESVFCGNSRPALYGPFYGYSFRNGQCGVEVVVLYYEPKVDRVGENALCCKQAKRLARSGATIMCCL